MVVVVGINVVVVDDQVCVVCAGDDVDGFDSEGSVVVEMVAVDNVGLVVCPLQIFIHCIRSV